MSQSENPSAYEYLLEAIASARTIDELTRLQGLARSHYSGRLLEDLETEVAMRRGVITRPAPDKPATE